MAGTRYDQYAKSPHTSEHMYNFLYGTWRNGKSTFLTVLYKVLGTYTCSVPIETFLVNSIGHIREDIARFRRKRFVLIAEATYGRLNEELLKRITGGDPITVRILRKNSFEFFSQCTIWMMGNYFPIIRGTDERIWS